MGPPVSWGSTLGLSFFLDKLRLTLAEPAPPAPAVIALSSESTDFDELLRLIFVLDATREVLE